MSDFLFSPVRRAAGELGTILTRFAAGVPHTLQELHGSWGSLALAQVPHEPDALMSDDVAITLVVGSPVVRFPELPARLLHDGPRRARVHRQLAAHAPVAERLDGAFALLHIDVATGAHHWATDRFAFIPLFRSRTGVIGTHVDAVARAAGVQHDVDPFSVVDLAANLSCTPPFTLYRHVEQLPAAMERDRTYWVPAERFDAYRSLDEAAAALRDGLAEGIGAAIGDAAQVGILLSAGEDSRVVLGSIPQHVQRHGFTYAEWESREVRIARRAAALYGASHRAGLRAEDHYVAHFPATAALLGSHHNFVDVHGYRLYQQIGLDTLPLVLGGLSADSLLKRVYAEDERTPWQTPRLDGVAEALHMEVDARRAALRAQLMEHRPTTSKEWLWLWPMALRKHGGNLDGNRRMFRAWEAFHANAVLEVATCARTEWKEGRRLFRRATRPLLARSWWLPHAEYRFPYFGKTGSYALLPGLALARGVRAVARGEVRARQRPWPKWGTLASSPVMRAREHELLQTTPLLAAIDAQPGAVMSWYSLRRVFFAQLAYAQSRAAAD